MSENSRIAICQNPKCNKEYVVSDVDDGFCSFECWEHVNCNAPKKKIETFDMSGLFV